MRKTLLSILSIALSTTLAFAQMSDSQVVDYVQRETKAGKSQSQIGTELMARGVTKAQIDRLRAQMEKSNASVGTAVGDKALDVTHEMTEKPQESARIVPSSNIYGHSIFTQRSLTFEPNTNAATPETYVLGPGDEIVIDIWGLNEANIRQTISPEGIIRISQVGPVQLSGLTIKQASNKISRLLRSKYESLGDNQSSVSVTLGKIRSIQINVLGEVSTPGTYRLSSFSTVLNALYKAGGVNSRGSIRNVKVIRGGEEFASVDVYEYILHGSSDTDVSLNEGDVIIVPTYERIVTIEGKIKRAMAYELRANETLADLIAYAGDFAPDAYRSDLRVTRQSGPEKEIFTVKAEDYAGFKLDDGDKVEVGASIDRYANMVEVRGFVFRPGTYQLGSDIATVRQLVERAGGLTEDAFYGRAMLIREKEDLSLENLSIDLAALLTSGSGDVLLRKNDVLVVSGRTEVETQGQLHINGLVRKPGSYDFTDNMTVEDLILVAGGLLDGSSTARVEVFRRSLDRDADSYSAVLGENFNFPMKDGLLLDGGDRFILQPYDIVTIRRSPGYRSARVVTLNGQVLYPGAYMLQHDAETITDLVKRAGGLTPTAYAKGTSVTRNNELSDAAVTSAMRWNSAVSKVKTDDQDAAASAAALMAQFQASRYNVAIDLESAMAHEHGNADIILKNGDVVNIPALQNEVRIIGEVMMPASVSYANGASLRSYVGKAGGFSKDARRNHAYVIYPNGSASKGLMAKVEPGSTIVVPAKGERKGMSLAETTSLSSASASILSAIALIANVIVK